MTHCQCLIYTMHVCVLRGGIARRLWEERDGRGVRGRPHGGVSALLVVVFFFAGFFTVLV